MSVKPLDWMRNRIEKTVDLTLASNDAWDKGDWLRTCSARTLAWLYASSDGAHRGSKSIASALRSLNAAMNKDYRGQPYGALFNRSTVHLSEAYLILEAAGEANLLPDARAHIEYGAKPLADHLKNYRYLTRFASGNLGTGTNHAAVYCSAVYRAGAILKRDDWMELGLSTIRRLAADQHPDGYYSETTPGPAMMYNTVTLAAIGRMAAWTGDAGLWDAADRSARFHQRFCYPDGLDIETFDGRNRYYRHPHLSGEFVHSRTPDGRGYVAKKFETYDNTVPTIIPLHKGFTSETIALLTESIQYWADGKTAEPLCARRNYVERMIEPAAVRRQGNWVASMQGIVHLPRAWGSFTIDRTGLFSVWNEKTGLIINGSGAPWENIGQTFKFPMAHQYDTIRYATPESVSIDPGAAGSSNPATLSAEYRGGTGRVSVRFISDAEIEIVAQAFARADCYPIPFALQLNLAEGDIVQGKTLGADPFVLGRELNGRVETPRWSLSFPPDSDATLQWPFDPYNPYDGVKHQSERSGYVPVLTFRLTPEPFALRLSVK